MAIYHLSVKTISRSAGRSAVAAAAYRSGEHLTDDRQGLDHDYTRKKGVEETAIILPKDAPDWSADRNALWNAAEAAEKRKNSVVAREIEIALPAELDADQRRELVMDYARAIVDRHACAVDVAIHAPSRDGDDRNHHAHLLMTTRRLDKTGYTEKTRELDQGRGENGEIEHWRHQWEQFANKALDRAGRAARLDRRSHKERGIDIPPTIHQGPSVTQIERQARRRDAREGRPHKPVTEIGQRNYLLDWSKSAVEGIRAFGEQLSRGSAAAAILARIGRDIARSRREQEERERVRALEQERLRAQREAKKKDQKRPGRSR